MVNRLLHTAPLLLLVACQAGSPTEPDDRIGGKADDGSEVVEGVASFDDDPSYVVRDRLDPIAGFDAKSSQPFSHLSRARHVFPFSAYGAASYRVQLSVDDPAMAGSSTVQVYGPRLADGSWAERRSAISEAGEAEVRIDTAGYGEYAIVVGPENDAGFLPRYPGHEAIVLAEDDLTTELRAVLDFGPDGEVRLEVYEDDSVARYEVVDPVTSRDSVTPEEAETGGILGQDDAGRLRTFYPVRWRRDVWLVEDGTTELVVAVLNDPYEGSLSIVHPDGTFDDYEITQAIGADGSPDFADPVMVRVVPSYDGEREIITTADPECDPEDLCPLVAIYSDDGTVVPVELERDFRSTHIDFAEQSTYAIELSCEGTCSPADTVPAARSLAAASVESISSIRTRHPIYFAHGFNSEGSRWNDVLEALVAYDPSLDGWISAGDVPAYEPLSSRAEALRRNLADVLAETPAASGDGFSRVNVIAHSMGGLDSRYLLGAEKYNNDQCHVPQTCDPDGRVIEGGGQACCVGADGAPQACCAADVDGSAIPWNRRIASLTTLSTPHCGSGFADWGLEGGFLKRVFRRIAHRVFGRRSTEEREALEQQLYNLSRDYCRELSAANLAVPNSDRIFDWDCATGRSDECDGSIAPADGNGPRADGDGGHMLPAPEERPTVFSWAAQACPSGNCGARISLTQVLAWRIVKRGDGEGPNDGLVSIPSARSSDVDGSSGVGVFMGVRANDHSGWLNVRRGFLTRTLDRVFDVRREDVGRWHVYWVNELARAGY